MMKRDQLKPYVYKVEGPVNFVLYDFFKGRIHQLSFDGATIKELRDYLLEEGLIFETNGIVPGKIMTDGMYDVQSTIGIRVLQIRLNGKGEDNCWRRTPKNGDLKYMAHGVLDKLISNCRHIPIKKIRIEAASHNDDMVRKILKKLEFEEIEFYVQNGIAPIVKKQYEEEYNDRGIVFLNDGRKPIKELRATIFNFFYSKFYNPCLGHQVAIDTAGEIKCCLWSVDVLGDINRDNLKDMIIMEKFDKYWHILKSAIKTCKDCELRYACDDCRAHSMQDTGGLNAKPPFCDYDPFSGF